MAVTNKQTELETLDKELEDLRAATEQLLANMAAELEQKTTEVAEAAATKEGLLSEISSKDANIAALEVGGRVAGRRARFGQGLGEGRVSGDGAAGRQDSSGLASSFVLK